MFLGSDILREMAKQRVIYCELVDAVKNLHRSIKRLQSGSREQNCLAELPDDIQLPLQSLEDAENLEKRLTDKQIKQSLVGDSFCRYLSKKNVLTLSHVTLACTALQLTFHICRFRVFYSLVDAI